MATSQAAQRYARALFDLASEQNVLSAVADDLASLRDLLEQSAELTRFVHDPIADSAGREAIIGRLFEGRIAPLTFQFLRFLLDKNRFDTLETICDEFASLYDTHTGVIRARIIAAHALDVEQLNTLTAQLTNRFSAKVVPTMEIDPDLVGGFIVVTGDQVFDYSIRTQLDRLRTNIINA